MSGETYSSGPKIAKKCQKCGVLIIFDYADLTRRGKPKLKEADSKLHHTYAQCKIMQWWSKRPVHAIVEEYSRFSDSYDE